MSQVFSSIKIESEQAATIAKKLFNVEGDFSSLPGELDFNFRIKTADQSYLLKISRPDEDEDYIEYQQALLTFLSKHKEVESPAVFPDLEGNLLSKITDENGNKRIVRLLGWMHGRLWSNVNPVSNDLLFSLGEQAGLVTKILQDFDHPKAHRVLEWDIASAAWTCDQLHLFDEDQKEILQFFQERFKAEQPAIAHLRKGVVHCDVNDNNIVVTDDLAHPKVKALIDYGDAVFTPIINDLAIALSYAVMHKSDMLSAALPVISGYHSKFPLEEKELELLYTATAMRLVISVTKSAQNKISEPDNVYLLVSEKPAWEVLKQWKSIHPKLAYFSFRNACGFTPHPQEQVFSEWTSKQKTSLTTLFPSLKFEEVTPVNMSVASTWLGNASEYTDNESTAHKLALLQKENPNTILAGGYSEIRPFYSTDAYANESNNGPTYRTVHLGVDFWVASETPVHAPFDGKVCSIHHNEGDKDYGPTLILEHQTENGILFYSLYGHLSLATLEQHTVGTNVSKGDPIASIGNPSENGNWAPHLHFQLMLDMLGNTADFPGVAFPENAAVWLSICPNPNQVFKTKGLEVPNKKENSELLAFRKKHLGKGMSLSYDEPLKMVRGNGVYLIDQTGRKYLDTVNNVAHVGHEHPKVVKAGQQQMALLNTNSRYLHENINAFTAALLETFPKKLSVVHFVNSGSEANELALRMAKTVTGQKDIIAIEHGYHGNTSACIEVSSYKFDGKGGQGAPEHTHIVPIPDTFRGIYTGAGAGEKYAAHVNEQINNIQSKGRNVAAFIGESIISCGGQIELPPHFLSNVYQTIKAAGGICIADEVQVGCGRVGSHFWGFEQHGVVPDIVTIGKPIGNGHPLAAVICTQEVAEAFANGMEYFNTFGGNPVSCAIGLEVLNVVQAEKLQKSALLVGNHLKKGLQMLQNSFPIIGDVRGQGLFLGFELTDKDLQPLPLQTAYLANRMKELGILMSVDGPDHNVIKIKPPMVFSLQNAHEVLFRLEAVLKEDFLTHF